MKAIITVGTQTELHKSSPSPHPAAQVPVLHYFPHQSVFSQVASCLEDLPSKMSQAPILFASVTCVT